MIGRLCTLIYAVVCWRAERMPRERGRALRAKWALRLYSYTTAGQDDDFAEELLGLVREMPPLLDELEAQVQGRGRIAAHRRLLIRVLRGLYA